MSKGMLRGLWLLAALVALGLLALTIALAVQASAQAARERSATLVGRSKVVVLRQEPKRGSGVAGIVDRGTAVELIDSDVRSDGAWYRVRTDAVSGWVEADDLALTPP
jgi:uncharacterized protein YgiM (DUF1202 family)